MTLDLSQYLSKQPVIQNVKANQKTEEEPALNLSAFRSRDDESNFESGVRHVTRTGSRALETIAGMPGDIVNFTKYLGSKLPEVPQYLQGEPSFIQRKGKELLESLPTSHSLKEKSEELSQGYTKATPNSNEELADDIASLTTSLSVPFNEPNKFLGLFKALGKSVFAKTSGVAAEKLGAGEELQKMVEMGSLFLTGLFGKKTADAFVSEQYKEARSAIPPGTMLPTNILSNELGKVEAQLSRGIPTATKKEVLKSVKDLKKKASGGAMEADEVVESFHNINEKLNSKKLFDELNSTERKLLKHRYDLFKDKVSDTIQDYGQYNPQFLKKWGNANQAFATIADSKKVTNFLESKIGSLPKHLAQSVAIELFLGHPKLAVSTVGAAGAVKTGELMYRMSMSPTLQKHYANTISAALNENLPAFIKGLSDLEEELKKLEEAQKNFKK